MLLTVNVAAIYEKCQQKKGQISIKKGGRFLPLSYYEWQVMGPIQVFYSYLVSEMIW